MTKNRKLPHRKHANLVKPDLGTFARNEWAIIGAPCSVIKDLVLKLASESKNRLLYIDETHNHEESVNELSVSTKMGKEQQLNQSISFNQYINQ